MSEQKYQTEAACGGSALTAELGALADQFECHALSRSIDDVEAAGRAMRAAKGEIERLRALLARQYQADAVLYAMPHDCAPNDHEAALIEHDATHAALAAELVPNA